MVEKETIFAPVIEKRIPSLQGCILPACRAYFTLDNRLHGDGYKERGTEMSSHVSLIVNYPDH
ncbi:MAG TPA: hypothetical protein VJ855_05130 [Marinilabiliaceae bacterium]|nr:hypothetical protein [Marinilabiliaceae bacterium]